jgi:rhodanese-related sulfurtransferase
VRAPVCASWLAQMSHDVYVLNEGARAPLQVAKGPQPKLPATPSIAPGALAGFMATGILLDLRSSSAYRQGHVEGARWATRSRLDAIARAGKPVVLMAVTDGLAQLAAVDLLEAGVKDVRIVSGDLAACKAAGLSVVATPDTPPDSERIDFLFFVHDRHEGNRAAMRGYLEWETGLLKQLDEQERSSFRIPTGAH